MSTIRIALNFGKEKIRFLGLLSSLPQNKDLNQAQYAHIVIKHHTMSNVISDEIIFNGKKCVEMVDELFLIHLHQVLYPLLCK